MPDPVRLPGRTASAAGAVLAAAFGVGVLAFPALGPLVLGALAAAAVLCGAAAAALGDVRFGALVVAAVPALWFLAVLLDYAD